MNWQFRVWFQKHHWNHIRWANFNMGYGLGFCVCGVFVKFHTPWQLFKGWMGQLL